MMNRPEKAATLAASYGVSPIQRQRELDAFEEQRQSYNSAMRDYEEAAAQPPVARFDAGGEVRKMFLEQTGRPAEDTAVDYFVERFGGDGKIDADELSTFRAMAGEEVVNNDARKAAAAAQLAAVTAANNTANNTAAATTRTYSPGDFLDTSQAARDSLRALAEQLVRNNAAKAATTAGTGTGGMADMAVTVYGPDGTFYGSPAEARAAGVTNYTMQPPAGVQAPTQAELREQAQQSEAARAALERMTTGGAQLMNNWQLPLTAAIAKDLMVRSMTTGVPTSEFDRYGGYKTVKNVYDQAGGSYDLKDVPKEDLTKLAQTVAQTGEGNLSILKQTSVPLSMAGFQNMLKNGIDPSQAASFMRQFGTVTRPPVPQPPPVLPLPLTGVNPVDYASNLTSSPVTFNRPTRRRRTGSFDQTYLSPDYSSMGVGAIGDVSALPTQYAAIRGPRFNKNAQRGNAATSPSSYFALSPQNSTGLAPGTMALGSSDMPLYGGLNTLNTLGAAPNLSPGMLGGLENAGYRTDRLGNRIYAPGAAPLFGFAKGGDVDSKALLAQNTETLSDDEPEEAINTDPLGSAQKMMADFSSVSQANPNVSPTRKAIKQTKSAPAKSGSAKMAYESLVKGGMGAMGTAAPALKDTDSAQAQMQELARIYQLKAQAAKERSRGFSADTLGAPTLEQPTLTKGKLTKKRFNKGGEAKKSEAKSAEEPSIFSVKSYATDAAKQMFPGQMGQDDQRDAARHMLAAAIMAKKFGPGTADFLGKAHERLSNPKSFFNMLGIGEPRYDYEPDMHNNRLGAELASRTTSQAELEKLVRAMAMQSQDKQVPGKPWTMTKEQLQAVDEKDEKAATPPQYRAGGSPEEGETSIKDQLIGAGETALTLGSGALSSVVGMPYGLYKGLTSGKYLEGKAPAIAEKEAQAFIERNTYVPRSTKGRENLEEINRLMEQSKLPPILPETAMLRSIPRAAVAAQGERIGMAAEKALDKPVTEVLKRGGKSAEMLKALSAPPSYAVRPTGSTMLSGPVGLDTRVGEVERMVQGGISNSRNATQTDLIKNFWEKKARNYFTRQFGTPDDPIAKGISNKTIKGSVLEELFPEYLIDATAVGKTRVKEGARPADFVGPGKPEERFFPKYPRAMEDFTKRYDEATDLKGNLITTNPAAADREYNSLSRVGRDMGRSASDLEADKMILQGLDPRLINNQVGVATRSIKEPDRIVTDGTSSAKDLYEAFEESSAYNKLSPEQKTAYANDMFGKGRPVAGMDETDIGKNLLSENVRTAIEKGEPIYDVGYMRRPLTELFNPVPINAYLDSLPPRELANIRFEDAVRGGLKVRERTAGLENLAARIKSGKPVADKFFSEGVSKPLLQFDKDSGLEGFAWKRIEKREATVPEGAYIGHSVGGYELGGPTYTKEKMEGFNTGLYRVYTLRDNRNRPVNTIEVKMEDANTPVVTQIKGNGRATGNATAEKYDGAILRFLQTYIKPSAISESDSYLTPLLQNYQTELQMERRAQSAIQRRRDAME